MSTNLVNINGVNGYTVGEPIVFAFSATTNATATASVVVSMTAALANVYPGSQIVGNGWPANDVVWVGAGANFNVTLSPTTVISSGSQVYFCNNVVTSLDSPAGQNNINFSYTNYPYRLVLLRLDISGSNTNAWLKAGDAIAYQTLESPGSPFFRSALAGTCSTEGVLNFSGVSNSVGGCGNGNNVIPYMVKFYTPGRGIDIAVAGDSHFAGDTTTAGMGSFGQRAALALNEPGVLPVWFQNYSRGGQPSMVYGPEASQGIKTAPPSIAVIQYTTPNDSSSSVLNVGNMQATANSLAALVRSQGGLPILASDYQRQRPGVTTEFSSNQAFRLAGEAALNRYTLEGVPTMDLSTICPDPTYGATFFGPQCSIDGIHMSDYAHSLAAIALQNLVKPYLRY